MHALVGEHQLYGTVRQHQLCKKLHVSQYNPRLKNEVKYNYHVKMFRDSLNSRPYLSPEYVKAENEKTYNAYSESIGSKAPFGYIESTGFDFQDDHLIFDFSYTNTNKKAIKSIDIHCNILSPAEKKQEGHQTQGHQPHWAFRDQILVVGRSCQQSP